MGKREIHIVGDTAFISLTKGYVATIDAADVPLVDDGLWQAWINPNGNVYAARKQVINGRRKTVRLHHRIVPVQKGEEVDHRDGDTLNNRRGNLRKGARSQNMRNLPIHRNGKVPGVYLDKRRGLYYATIFLGSYQSREEAESAQKIAAKRLLKK